MNEQTATYAIIPVLQKLLQNTYSQVIPINFWSTREGSGKAIESLSGQAVKVLAVYPRRPKTAASSPGCVFIKINQRLYDHSAKLSEVGIPVLAAAPLVEGLHDLNNEAKCGFFFVEPEHTEQILQVGLDNDQIAFPRLSNQGCIDLVAYKSKVMDYRDVVSAIRNSNRSDRGFFLYNGWAQYKPFYFLCLTPTLGVRTNYNSNR